MSNAISVENLVDGMLMGYKDTKYHIFPIGDGIYLLIVLPKYLWAYPTTNPIDNNINMKNIM